MVGIIKPRNPTIILNSGRLAARATEEIKRRVEWQNIKSWRIWQHSDDEADRATQVICTELGDNYSIGTLNQYWEGYNDLNKFWTDAPEEQRSELVRSFSGTAPVMKFFDSSATAAHRGEQSNKPKL